MAEAFKKIAKAEVEISRTKFLLKCLWSELGANSNNLNRYLQKAEEELLCFQTSPVDLTGAYSVLKALTVSLGDWSEAGRKAAASHCTGKAGGRGHASG